jgi:hypothetical protein
VRINGARRSFDRSRALMISISRLRGSAVVTSDPINVLADAAISSMARSNACRLAFRRRIEAAQFPDELQ